MNILFISFDADPPYMGGTSTVVNILAKAFQAQGHFVALGYFEDSIYPSTFFKTKIKFEPNNRDAIDLFMVKYSFDVIYNTQAMNTDFVFLKSLPLGHCKIVSAYHNKPLLRFLSLESLLNLYYESDSFSYKLYTLAKIPLLPLWKYRSKKNERMQYREMVRYSDKIQLLSEKFYPCFINIVPEVELNKLTAVENPIVYDTGCKLTELNSKKKKVLVVCSTNYQKRADLMIRIWAEIEKDKSLYEWSFDFIGGGEGFEKIKKRASTLSLKRINFLGFHNPQEYYKLSSLFMMTSRYEGWPMVLMEALQMGVVPIVFNSFESLTDILEDGQNGCIVKDNDIHAFVERLKWLMKNDEARLAMAANAINSCDRFTIDKVLHKFMLMFESL